MNQQGGIYFFEFKHNQNKHVKASVHEHRRLNLILFI